MRAIEHHANEALRARDRIGARRRAGWPALATLLVAIVAAAPHAPGRGAATDPATLVVSTREPPPRLHDTGLYADSSSLEIARDVIAFSPQYPLWSDGADKQRWLRLPPGASIDGSNPDAWAFPPGTTLWKQFSHAGRKVETRLIERLDDGSWRFAAYAWDDRGTDAVLVPAAGIAALPVREAPRGRYAVPSREDCLACHGSAAVPVLGLSALQLSPDRDPGAPHAAPARAGDADLRELVARGALTRLPAALLETPPRIEAASALERAVFGYLHGNCAHCHNTSASRAPVRLTLAQSAADPAGSRRAIRRSLIDAPSRYRPPGMDGEPKNVTPGSVADSVLAVRMQSRHPQVQMPPLGTVVPDTQALDQVLRWISAEVTPSKELRP